MTPLNGDNIDKVLEEFSSDELANLSDDLLNIAVDLTLHSELDLLQESSIARGNDLLVFIPKILASRLNKAEVYSQKFNSLKNEDLIFAGYSIQELQNIRDLLEDVITFIERRTSTDLNSLYQEVFEELKDNVEINVEFYRKALKTVNDAYLIQSRHLMTQAIEVYKRVTSYRFEHFLLEKIERLEGYGKHLNSAVELLESSDDLRERYSHQLSGLRETLILVLEAINTQTIGSEIPHKRRFYISDILYHVRDALQEYIFQILRRFAEVAPDGTIQKYMPPEEIAVRYRNRYIKHNRALMGVISNSIGLSQADILEVSNNILQHLSSALNVKLQFVRAERLCEHILENTRGLQPPPYAQERLQAYYRQLQDALRILEHYPINSDYLEILQGQCYQVSVMLMERLDGDHLHELADLLRHNQLYAARRLFALRISAISLFISSYSAQQLSEKASQRIFTVCRDLIEYKYDFLKPSAVYLELILNLEHYRSQVISKIDHAVLYLEGNPPEETPEEDASTSRETLTPFVFQGEPKFDFSFSQIVIDCLALKIQELDKPIENLLEENNAATQQDLQNQINSSRERVKYFSKQYQEESKTILSNVQNANAFFQQF
ncbi:MAG: hypothetical protein GY801_43545 [bacterium]|nr:hypothetical protein [bacterium]